MVTVLDGDRMRQGLCSDLGFSKADRAENIRRISHVADLVANTGATVLVATISPLQEFRDLSRSILPDMIEVFVDAPLAVCESRDPKGLYSRARSGQLSGFTGIDSPFEVPDSSEVVCQTAEYCIAECTERLLGLFDLSKSVQDAPRLNWRPTVAVDFDGVIAEYDGWKGAAHLGDPRPDVTAALVELKKDGWKIIVHTTRQERAVRPYLEVAAIPFDEINCNSDYPHCSNKPVASVYWDDRALTYTGDAIQDLPRIRSFRTWNGRR